MQKPVGETRDATISLVLGAIAMIAMPMSYQWLTRPGLDPQTASVLVPLAQYGGLACALVAFFFGRRARAAGDTSLGAVWGIRLGGAAVVGFFAILVFFAARYG